MPRLTPRSHDGLDAKLVPNMLLARRRGGVRNVSPLGYRGFQRSRVTRFSSGFDGGTNKNGLWVRDEDGYHYKNWTYDKAKGLGYADDDIFVVGRDGYYLTLEEARQAIPDGVMGVHYVDDFNDEFQDFFVCKADGIQPEPFDEAQAPEPIQ